MSSYLRELIALACRTHLASVHHRHGYLEAGDIKQKYGGLSHTRHLWGFKRGLEVHFMSWSIEFIIASDAKITVGWNHMICRRWQIQMQEKWKISRAAHTGLTRALRRLDGARGSGTEGTFMTVLTTIRHCRATAFLPLADHSRCHRIHSLFGSTKNHSPYGSLRNNFFL